MSIFGRRPLAAPDQLHEMAGSESFRHASQRCSSSGRSSLAPSPPEGQRTDQSGSVRLRLRLSAGVQTAAPGS